MSFLTAESDDLFLPRRNDPIGTLVDLAFIREFCRSFASIIEARRIVAQIGVRHRAEGVAHDPLHDANAARHCRGGIACRGPGRLAAARLAARYPAGTRAHLWPAHRRSRDRATIWPRWAIARGLWPP